MYSYLRAENTLYSDVYNHWAVFLSVFKNLTPWWQFIDFWESCWSTLTGTWSDFRSTCCHCQSMQYTTDLCNEENPVNGKQWYNSGESAFHDRYFPHSKIPRDKSTAQSTYCLNLQSVKATLKQSSLWISINWKNPL